MTLHPHLLWGFAGVGGLLVVAGLVTGALHARSPTESRRELRDRIRSWWWIAGVFALAVILGRVPSLILLAFVNFLALKEYLSLIPTRRADRRVLFWVYLSIPVQYLWIYQGWYGMFIITIPVYLFLLLPLRMLLVGETQGFLRAIGTIHWGLMMTVFCPSHAAYLLSLSADLNPAGGGGAGLLFYLVLLTALNDVAQYAWGKTLGRRPISPTVSPKKTWEGLLGGVLTTAALALLLRSFLTPFDMPRALGAGLLIGIGGFIGDVTVSMLKRDLGIKDSGTILPGHGGILDRTDSLVYTAPLFFHYAYFLLTPRLTTL